jgi:hypothetical protein
MCCNPTTLLGVGQGRRKAGLFGAMGSVGNRNDNAMVVTYGHKFGVLLVGHYFRSLIAASRSVSAASRRC